MANEQSQARRGWPPAPALGPPAVVRLSPPAGAKRIYSLPFSPLGTMIFRPACGARTRRYTVHHDFTPSGFGLESGAERAAGKARDKFSTGALAAFLHSFPIPFFPLPSLLCERVARCRRDEQRATRMLSQSESGGIESASGARPALSIMPKQG